MPKLQIFILTYNRPKMVLEMIDSVLSQSFGEFQLIVSDNSTGHPVDPGSLPKDDRLLYRRRIPSLSSLKHFGRVQDEVTAPFYMVLHDDDVLLPSAVEKLMARMEKSPNCVAVAGNANLLEGDRRSKAIFNDISSEMIFSSQRQFLERYLRPDFGVHPFPIYLFRRSLAQAEPVDSGEGGKYTDATFLTRLLRHGIIVWMPEVIFFYRIHPGNDSGVTSIRDSLKVLSWACRNQIVKKTDFSALTWRVWYVVLRERDLRRKRKYWRKSVVFLLASFAVRHPLFIARFLWIKVKKKLTRSL